MDAVMQYVGNPYIQTYVIVLVLIVILARSYLYCRPDDKWVPPVVGIPVGVLLGWFVGWLLDIPSKRGMALGFGSQVGAVFSYELTKHVLRDIVARIVEVFKVWKNRNNG